LKLEVIHKIFGAKAGDGFEVKKSGVFTEVQGIVPRHKGNIRFFTGLEKDFDPSDDANYPAFFISPITVSPDLRTEQGESVKNWNFVCEMLDLLPEDRDPDSYNDVLNRTLIQIDEILLSFFLDFGDKTQETRYRGDVSITDFNVALGATYVPWIDKGAQNVTGWQGTFTITETLRADACCLDDIIKPL